MGVLDFLRLPPAHPYVNRASVRTWLGNVEPPDLDQPELPLPFADPNYYDDDTSDQSPQSLPVLPQRPVIVNPPEAMTKYDYSSFNVSYSSWENPYGNVGAREPSYNTTNNVLVTEISTTPYTRSLGPVQHTSPPAPEVDEYLEPPSDSEDEDGERMLQLHRQVLAG
jgi:hypothetical protein